MMNRQILFITFLFYSVSSFSTGIVFDEKKYKLNKTKIKSTSSSSRVYSDDLRKQIVPENANAKIYSDDPQQQQRQIIDTVVAAAVAESIAAANSSSSSDGSVTLQPVCHGGGLCGASFLGQQKQNLLMTGFEIQKTLFKLRAKDLFIKSSEHIAVGLMSQDEPINSDGSFKSTASGGAIGIAMGELSNQYHPCPADPNNLYVEIGIEVFGTNDPLSSVIVPGCKQILKSDIAATNSLNINIELSCKDKLCSAEVDIKNESGRLLTHVETSGQKLRNPTLKRDIWYAVTNFSTDPVIETAKFEIVSENYSLQANDDSAALPVPEIIFSLNSNGDSVAGPINYDSILYTRLVNMTPNSYAVAVPIIENCPALSQAHQVSKNSTLLPVVGVRDTFESRVDLSQHNLPNGFRVCIAQDKSTEWKIEKTIEVAVKPEPRRAPSSDEYSNSSCQFVGAVFGGSVNPPTEVCDTNGQRATNGQFCVCK